MLSYFIYMYVRMHTHALTHTYTTRIAVLDHVMSRPFQQASPNSRDGRAFQRARRLMRCGAQSWVADARGAPSAPVLARSSLSHDAKVKDFMVGRGGVNLKAPDRKWERTVS